MSDAQRDDREGYRRAQHWRSIPTDPDIVPEIEGRWSPYAFSMSPIDDEDLRAIFDAGRWAASSRNEQPWRFVVVDREESEHHERFVDLLSEGNRDWARRAPVLIFAFVQTTFESTGSPNRVALHDLGQAVAQMSIEATSRGLQFHQMAGIRREAIREAFDPPDDIEPVTAIAVGAPADPDEAPEELVEKDRGTKSRKPLDALVFDERWGEPEF